MRYFSLALTFLCASHSYAAQMEPLSYEQAAMFMGLAPFSQNGYQEQIPMSGNPTPFAIALWISHEADADECLSGDAREVCRPETVYIALSMELGTKFGFKTPKGFNWRLEDIRAAVTSNGARCARFTLSEDVFEGEKPNIRTRREKTVVCADANGFVDLN